MKERPNVDPEVSPTPAEQPRERPWNLSELWEERDRDGLYGRPLALSPFEHDQGQSLWVWYDSLVDVKQRAEKEKARADRLQVELDTWLAGVVPHAPQEHTET